MTIHVPQWSIWAGVLTLLLIQLHANMLPERQQVMVQTLGNLSSCRTQGWGTGLALAAVGIWEINYQMENLSLLLCLSNKQTKLETKTDITLVRKRGKVIQIQSLKPSSLVREERAPGLLTSTNTACMCPP